MGIVKALRLRAQRQRLLVRAIRSRRQLARAANRTGAIRPDDILLFACLRNERNRLPYFLNYYRKLGVQHFLLVDNGSTDGSGDYLQQQPDVSLWRTGHSYRAARFGADWVGWLQFRYGHGHWSVVVDLDEFLVYPFCDTRPLRALTDWLDASDVNVFPAMLLDMYPKGPIEAQPCAEGQNPFEIAAWFDSGNYMIQKNRKFGNLWITGGARARSFFADQPDKAPALNKLPLVKWNRRFAYVGSTHMLLPGALNLVYDEWGGERGSGCLLHAKFVTGFADKAQEELTRGEHYADSVEYRAYRDAMLAHPDLWSKWSEKYINWRQLEILGLMSKGSWA